MTAVDAACGSCGTGLRVTAKFCDECGTPTAGSVETAKYKQVTVLFADVVRSMDIAASVDPERLRHIMTELVERSAAVIRRYGGTVEYNGDGVMALFGAPIAFEDHAFRGCLAAMDLQAEAQALAAEVQRSDSVTLQLRIGLNSGLVIAGTLGSGSLGYHATGSTVGLGQRIESVAPAGEVLLSETTAKLVENRVTLGEPQWMRIKGSDQPVRTQRLVGIGPARRVRAGRAEASLVGRRAEMAALGRVIDRAVSGRGAVVTAVGPAGIGKSRVAREVAALAARHNAEVFWVFCESHAHDVPFRAATRLLRASSGVGDLDGDAARAALRAAVSPHVGPNDLRLLEDLLGIAEPDAALPRLDPDARRRRLIEVLNAVWLARTQPALFVIEDAHWIDGASESLLADLLTVIPRTPSMVLVTARPEYHGALTSLPGAHTITLAPLDDSDTGVLLAELLGSDPSVDSLTVVIADRAAGNPFFAEEMVREFAQRGVLIGAHGDYICRADVADVAVPATVQATIEARIDRLTAGGRRTLHAASVIGARFGADLLAALDVDARCDELLTAELIDPVHLRPAEYAFRHPLIRAVAYDSQLKSDRAQWHRRLAAAIQARCPESADENAALIAGHLEAAGELHHAHSWHMRAGTWSTHRDIAAARASWERARSIADRLPSDDTDRTALRIAPRTMLCVSARRATQDVGSGLFDEMRELCAAADDKASLAIAMTGLMTEALLQGQAREASRLASQQMALLESIGDRGLTIAATYTGVAIKGDTGEMADVLRWSQTVIDLADGDPLIGANLGIGSPLAAALVWRGIARYWLGLDGWRGDLDDAVAMARSSDPATYALIVAYRYHSAIQNGVLRADATAVGEVEDALQLAEGLSGDTALGLIKGTLSGVLLSRDAPADRQRGFELLTQVRDMWQRERSRLYLLPIGDVYAAREMARRGDRDGAIPLMRECVNQMYEAGRYGYGVPLAGVLVETLLDRSAEGDVAEAQLVIDRLAAQPPTEGLAVRDIWCLRLRALLAGARGDAGRYADLVARYRAMARSLGFEGHIAWAEAMAETCQLDRDA